MTRLTQTSTSRKKIAWLAGLVLVACAIAYVLKAISVPFDSPIARMYRTEADLTMLSMAIEFYHAEWEVYPPAGDAGLDLAAAVISQQAIYLPSGPPPDGWARSFVYVPHDAYANSDSGALSQDDAYFAPETFQLYSLGVDGLSGAQDWANYQDNILSWDTTKSWRALYEQLQQSFLNEEEDTP